MGWGTDRGAFRDLIIDYEKRLPHFTPRANGFLRVNGILVPPTIPRENDNRIDRDGIIDRDLAVTIMKSLRHHLTIPSEQRHIAHRMRMWRYLRSLVDMDADGTLVEELRVLAEVPMFLGNETETNIPGRPSEFNRMNLSPNIRRAGHSFEFQVRDLIRSAQHNHLPPSFNTILMTYDQVGLADEDSPISQSPQLSSSEFSEFDAAIARREYIALHDSFNKVSTENEVLKLLRRLFEKAPLDDRIEIEKFIHMQATFGNRAFQTAIIKNHLSTMAITMHTTLLMHLVSLNDPEISELLVRYVLAPYRINFGLSKHIVAVKDLYVQSAAEFLFSADNNQNPTSLKFPALPRALQITSPIGPVISDTNELLDYLVKKLMSTGQRRVYRALARYFLPLPHNGDFAQYQHELWKFQDEGTHLALIHSTFSQIASQGDSLNAIRIDAQVHSPIVIDELAHLKSRVRCEKLWPKAKPKH